MVFSTQFMVSLQMLADGHALATKKMHLWPLSFATAQHHPV